MIGNRHPEEKYRDNPEELKRFLYTEKFPVVEVCNGNRALYDEGHDFPRNYDGIPANLHYFAVRDEEADNPEETISTLEDRVLVNRFCSLLTKKDLLDGAEDFEGNRFKELKEDDQVDFTPMYEEDDMSISDFAHEDDPEYEVIIEETFSKTFKVKAESEEDAKQIALDMYSLDIFNVTHERPNFTNVCVGLDGEFKEFHSDKKYGGED